MTKKYSPIDHQFIGDTNILFADPPSFEEETTSPAAPASGAKVFTRAGQMWVKTPTSEYPLAPVSTGLGFINNGDFEAVKSVISSSGYFEPQNWNGFWHGGDGYIATETVDYSTGVRSVRCHIGAANSDNVVCQSDVFGIIGGGVLLLDFNAKGAVGGQILVELQTSVDNTNGAPDFFATGTTVTGSQTVVFADTVWNHYSRAIQLPAGHKLCRVTMRHMHAGADATAREAYIDTVVGRMQSDVVSGAFGNLPVGAVVPFGSNVIPAGFLLCDGRAISRASYSDLFTAIGTAFGVGDGTTTFNLPNFKGRVPVGLDSADGNMDAVGDAFGEKTHAMTSSELVAHGHAFRADGMPSIVIGNAGQTNAYWFNQGSPTMRADSIAATMNSGGSVPFNLMQPYVTVQYIIRAIPSAGTDSTTVQYFKGTIPGNVSTAVANNTNLPFPNRIDPANAWNTTNNYWVVPANGRYRITVASKANAAVARTMRIYKNGAVANINGESINGMASGLSADVLDLLAGDTIAVNPSSAFTTNNEGTATVSNTYLIIESVGLTASTTLVPAAPIWRSLTLASQYNMLTTAQTIGWNGTNVGSGLPLSTDTTKLTVDVPGAYFVSAQCTFQQSGGGGGMWFIVNIIQKRASGTEVTRREAVSSTASVGLFVAIESHAHFDALAGDTFEVQVTCQYASLSNIQPNRCQFDAHKV